MTVNAHACPGTHHLEPAKLAERGVFYDIHTVLFDVDDDGVMREYHLIDLCDEWPATIMATLIPQDHAARVTAER